MHSGGFSGRSGLEPARQRRSGCPRGGKRGERAAEEKHTGSTEASIQGVIMIPNREKQSPSRIRVELLRRFSLKAMFDARAPTP